MEGGDAATVIPPFPTLALLVAVAVLHLWIPEPTGRTILWGGYWLGILINMIVLLAIISLIQTASVEARLSNRDSYRAVTALLNVFDLWHRPLFIPAIVYAIALYKTWSQIEKEQLKKSDS